MMEDMGAPPALPAPLPRPLQQPRRGPELPEPSCARRAPAPPAPRLARDATAADGGCRRARAGLEARDIDDVKDLLSESSVKVGASGMLLGHTWHARFPGGI